MRNLTNLTDNIRNLLVEPQIAEENIQEGMNVFYAQGQPVGAISLDMVKVGSVIEGRLLNGLRGFKGILQNGENGSYRIGLNHRLEVTSFDTDKILTSIYDKSKSTSFSQEEMVEYKDGVLSFEWRNPDFGTESLEGTHMIKDNDTGIYLISRKDPKTTRLITPGLGIVPDENTLSFGFERDKYWKIVQEVINGPKGEFVLPGYRNIPEDVFEAIRFFQNPQ